MAASCQSSLSEELSPSSCSDGAQITDFDRMVMEMEDDTEKQAELKTSNSLNEATVDTGQPDHQGQDVLPATERQASTDSFQHGCMVHVTDSSFKTAYSPSEKPESSSSVNVSSSSEQMADSSRRNDDISRNISPQNNEVIETFHSGDVPSETGSKDGSAVNPERQTSYKQTLPSSPDQPQTEDPSLTPDSCDGKHRDETDHSDSDIISLSEEDISNEGATNFVITNVCSLSDKCLQEKHSMSDTHSKTDAGEKVDSEHDSSGDNFLLIDVTDIENLASSPGEGDQPSGSSSSGLSILTQSTQQQSEELESGLVLDFEDLRGRHSSQILTSSPIQDKPPTVSSVNEIPQAMDDSAAGDASHSPKQSDVNSVGVCQKQHEVSSAKCPAHVEIKAEPPESNFAAAPTPFSLSYTKRTDGTLARKDSSSESGPPQKRPRVSGDLPRDGKSNPVNSVLNVTACNNSQQSSRDLMSPVSIQSPASVQSPVSLLSPLNVQSPVSIPSPLSIQSGDLPRDRQNNPVNYMLNVTAGNNSQQSSRYLVSPIANSIQSPASTQSSPRIRSPVGIQSPLSIQSSVSIQSPVGIFFDTASLFKLLKQPGSITPTSLSPKSSTGKPTVTRSACASASKAGAKTTNQVTSFASSSIVLTLPALLPKSMISTSAGSEKSAGPNSHTVTSPSSAGSVTKGRANSKEFNDKVMTHLHGIQGKPGSHQVLKIPMADGSTHTVKVIFAPQARPPSSTAVSAASAASTTSKLSSVTSTISSTASQVPGVTSISLLHSALAAVSKSAAANRKKPTAILPKPGNLPKATAGSLQLVSMSPQVKCGKKSDEREGRLSAGDMAALIQGQNQLPTYHPPTECPGVSAPPPLFRCTECGDTFCTVIGYSAHMKRMSMVIQYACATCKIPLVFFSKCTFLAHLRLHASVEQTSGIVLNLKSHTMSVSSLPTEFLPPVGEQHLDPFVANHRVPLDCTECKMTVPTTLELARHFGCDIPLCHYAHTCPHCAMELPTACSLKAHLRLHQGDPMKMICAEAPYVCPECGLCFPNQKSLYQHLFSTCLHFTRMVPVHCKECSKMALSRQALKIHVEHKHKLQSVFQCVLCDYRCKLPHFFREHLASSHNVSAGPNPSTYYILFKYCPMCKTYLQKNFKSHLAQHAADSALSALFEFACFLCSKTLFLAPTRQVLIRHLTAFHKAYRFTCAICHMGFVSVSVLRVHILSQHTGSEQHCQTCASPITMPEAALPHAMWHMLKDLSDGNLPKKEASTFMDVIMPKKTLAESLRFCRMCSHMFSSHHALQQHLRTHRFLDTPVCVVCQRVDFYDKHQAEMHQVVCLHQKKLVCSTDVDNSVDSPEVQHSVPNGDGRLRPGSPQEEQVGPGDAAGKKRSLSSDMLGTSGPPAKKQASGLGTQRPYTCVNKPSQPNQRLPALKSPRKPAWMAVQKLHPAVEKKSKIRITTSSSSDEEVETSDAEGSVSHFPPFLQDHVSAETAPSLQYHPCHLCGLMYEAKETLMSHYASVHSGKKNGYICLVCRQKGKEQSFSKKQLLIAHCVRKHRLSAQKAEGMAKNEAIQPPVQNTGEVYPVPVASKPSRSLKVGAPDKGPVKRLRVAGNMEEFVCAKCMFSTNSQENFHSHITQHKVDNCVQCLECGLCFSVIPSLKNHLFLVHRIHQPQSYIEENNITVQALPDEVVSHMNHFSPLGDQEFVINLSRTPTYHEEVPKSVLEPVEERKQSENMLECTVCYREFEDEVQLKTHMRTHGMAFIRSRRYNTRDPASRQETAVATDSNNEKNNTVPASQK